MRYISFVRGFVGRSGVVSGTHFNIPGKSEKDVIASHKLIEVNDDFAVFRLPGGKIHSVPLLSLTICAPVEEGQT